MSEWSPSRKQKPTGAGEDVVKSSYTLLVGMENNMEVLRKIKNRSTTGSSNSTSQYKPTGNENRISIGYHSIITAKTWNNPKAHQQMNG